MNKIVALFTSAFYPRRCRYHNSLAGGQEDSSIRNIILQEHSLKRTDLQIKFSNPKKCRAFVPKCEEFLLITIDFY